MTRTRLGALISTAVYIAVVWYVITPGHTDPRVSAWHAATRVFATLARVFGSLALVCESRYWRAVGA